MNTFTTRKTEQPASRYRSRAFSRIAVLAAIALAAQTAFAQPKQPPGKQPQKPPGGIANDIGFKKLDEMLMELPTVKQLLTEKPVDWVVLNNLDVVVTKPVKPRPNTLEKIQQRIEAGKKLPLAQQKKLPFLYVTVIDGGANPEKKIHYTKIKQILHHEDLLLMRIAKLQDKGDFALAFELLFNLKRSKPNWPSIPQYEKRQLLTESKRHLEQKQYSAALVRLEELHKRDANYENGAELLGQAADALASAALKTNDLHRARHYLGRLGRLEPKHPVFEKHRKVLEGRAAALLKQANAAADAGRHDQALALAQRAVKVWPPTPGLRSAYETMYGRFQNLRVGVLQLPGEKSAYFLSTLADERRNYLYGTPLFESQTVDEIVYYSTRYFDEWTPTDLGRRTVFQLQSGRKYWQPQPAVTASQVARTLRERLDPKSPHYDERLTTYVRSVRVESPTRLELRFSRVPPRLESLLRFPLLNTNAKAKESKSAKSLGPVLASARFAPYRPETWTPTRQVYRRFTPEPDGVPGNRYHVAQVEEVRYGTPLAAIQALKRGQIDMLAHVPPVDAGPLQRDHRISVRKYSVPVTHVLQFNPDSAPLHDREFRRALAYSLDRPSMLRGIVLRTQDGTDPRAGRVVSAPYAQNNYAYERTVRPKKYDIMLALALTLTVRKQYQRAYEASVGAALVPSVFKRGAKLGWVPKLRMLVPPGETPRKVAEACVNTWKRIGIPVEIIDPDRVQKGPPRWDIVYRTARIIDPVTELWPFLTFDDRARVEGLRNLPDWLRQELIRVDLASDWSDAVKRLRRLHDHLEKETLLIPLWEVDDYLALRRNVKAFRRDEFKPVHTYQNIEQWVILPQNIGLMEPRIPKKDDAR